MKTWRIALIPGDGIGPEVTAGACQVLSAVSKRLNCSLVFTKLPAGGEAIDAAGEPLPAATLAACQTADAVLLGAVGGPKWDQPGARVRPEQALLGLRAGLGLFANLRPARLLPDLAAACPLRADIAARGFDILFVRELTGGIYFGPQGRRQGQFGEEAFDTEVYSVFEADRIARVALRLAQSRRGKVTSIDKANILESSRLWRAAVTAAAADFPDVTVDHLYVDNASMQLIRRPYEFDVIVAGNMFGDILSDEAAMITGSIGLLPSASLGEEGKPGLYEPIHGSAPDIAGRDKANPLATILSAAMMLRHSLQREAGADLIEQAVHQVLAAGWRTRDLATAATEPDRILGTRAMSEQVVAAIEGA